MSSQYGLRHNLKPFKVLGYLMSDDKTFKKKITLLCMELSEFNGANFC